MRVHDTARVTLRIGGLTSNGEKIRGGPQEISFVLGDGEACDELEGSILDLKKDDEALER